MNSKEMKAPDTVMKVEDMVRHPCWPNDQRGLLKAQAEITGKIMKQEGVKEVVEWLTKEKDVPIRYAHNATCYDCIERLKLNKWGIK